MRLQSHKKKRTDGSAYCPWLQGSGMALPGGYILLPAHRYCKKIRFPHQKRTGLHFNNPVLFASLARKMIKSSHHNPVRLSWKGPGGNHSQEQIRRVCDATMVNMARIESIRKHSAGYAMLLQRIPSRKPFTLTLPSSGNGRPRNALFPVPEARAFLSCILPAHRGSG